MDWWIGIDDTDNLDGPGTGRRARQLGELLQRRELGRLQQITRHQLLVDERIPYTSHNSSACLRVEAPAAAGEALQAACREFLLRESAPEADAGLCVAGGGQSPALLAHFGRRAKQCVLTMDAAYAAGRACGVYLQGLTGTGGGVIGALAAVGLACGGEDGRFLWLPQLRGLKGRQPVGALMQATGIAVVCTRDGRTAPAEAYVDVGDWFRPVLRGGKAVLFVEEVLDGTGEWRILAKETIKQFSE